MPIKKPMSRYGSLATMPCWVSLLGVPFLLANWTPASACCFCPSGGGGRESADGRKEVLVESGKPPNILPLVNVGFTLEERTAGIGGTPAFGSVLASGGGFGFRGLASAEAAEGLCCGVFHNDAKIPNRLGLSSIFFYFFSSRECGPPNVKVSDRPS